MAEISPKPVRRDGGAPSNGSLGPWNGLAPEFVRSAAADRLKALGHSDRLRIVEVLAGGGKNVGEIAASMGLPNATVSRHLRVLYDAQVVLCSRRGNFVLYVLADRDVVRLAAVAYSGAGRQARRVLSFAPPD
jgi:DNA-binding transcriptional ArsR family regulator